MKALYILLVISSVSLIMFCITDCNEPKNNIISKVEVHKDSCYYKVNNYWKRDNTLCCSDYVLLPCGIYNDGDTLKIE